MITFVKHKQISMLTKIIHNHLKNPDDYLVGFADLHGLLDASFDNYQYGISIAKRLDAAVIDGIENGPTVAYYEYYKKINTELAELTKNIQQDLIKIGIHSVLIEPTVMLTTDQYLQTLTTSVSHKMVATRAGLGWIGKTDLFVSKKFGPRVRLVSILIDYKPESIGTPIEKSRCANCTECVRKCPAQAANGKLWDIHVHRDEFFNPHLCKEQAEYFGRSVLKIERRICGICVSVCPRGKKRIG